MAKRRSKGDGAIYFDEKRGLYVGQIGVGYDERGKRKRKTVYGKTKAEVRTKIKNIDLQIFTGTFTDENDVTIYHLAKQFLDDKLNQNEIKPTTYYRHIETLKALRQIYNTPIQTANETQLRAFLNSRLYYSQSYINKIYELLNKTFREAARRKIITENPMEHIKKPHSKKKTEIVRALTKDEQRKLIHVLLTEDINYSQQMLLSMAAGFRMGEINALFVETVNFTFNRVKVQRTISRGEKGEAILSDTAKTDAGTRILTMTEDVRELLRDCIGDKKSGLIFTHKGKMISTSQVNSQFRRVLKKYDILDKTITDGKVDLHSLRHTFGTRCAEAGMPPKVLQEIMGHTDISVTMNTYFYATRDYIDENIYKVDNILKNEGLSIAPDRGENQYKAI
ncbi:MAG: site-specific integrase [Clostridia bacterium]|nr:site-specific integrase [Clostridia bacterium]